MYKRSFSVLQSLFLNVTTELHNIISHLLPFTRFINLIIKIGESNTKNGYLPLSKSESSHSPVCVYECIIRYLECPVGSCVPVRQSSQGAFLFKISLNLSITLGSGGALIASIRAS